MRSRLPRWSNRSSFDWHRCSSDDHPSCEDYLLLNHRRSPRRIVQVHTDWLNDVERELGARTRR